MNIISTGRWWVGGKTPGAKFPTPRQTINYLKRFYMWNLLLLLSVLKEPCTLVYRMRQLTDGGGTEAGEVQL